MQKPRPIKTKLRRIARKRQRQVEDISYVADEQINKHFFRRLARLSEVKRFVLGWLGLVILLILVVILQSISLRDQFEKPVFISGGVFNEGIVGTYTNSNPIYATGSVDLAVSKLVFASLFKYDAQDNLAPGLAEKIEVDKTEKIYTVTLKENIYWHDGQPVSADDVAFTFNTIKNPEAKSYLLPSWQGVKIEAKNTKTVIFTLKDTLSSFPHSLTVGLIPKHILKDISQDQLRSSEFNSIRAIGSGPFKLSVVEAGTAKDDASNEVKKQQIGLVANEGYYGGAPRLSRYVIKTFNDQASLEQAYRDKTVSSISGLFSPDESITADIQTSEFWVPLAGQVMVFFKTSEGVLKDTKVRQALVLGANRGDILSNIGYSLKGIDEPLLRSQIGYNQKYVQKTGNIAKAKTILDKAGWKLDKQTGIRVKNKKPLKFQLNSEATSEYSSVTQTLQAQWKELGVDLVVNLQDDEDLTNTVAGHNYDALLYAISVGADPDVFAFWHSSQADPRSKSRLNFSEYESDKADDALTAGRSRSNPKIRAVKYEPFLKAWQVDNPALALYQPRFVFLVREPFEGFSATSLVSPTERYNDVEKWSIRQEKRSN